MKGSCNNINGEQIVLALEAAIHNPIVEEDQASNSSSSCIEYSQEKRRTHKLMLKKESRVIKKRKNMHKSCSRTATKRSALEVQEETHSSLSFEKEDPWKIKKVLTREVDLSNRLLLGKGLIAKNILPYLDESSAKSCNSRVGILFKIWDVDTESEHELVLKKWYTHYFAITGDWKRDFVERRSLKMNDEIRIGLDAINSRFCFRVIRKSQD